MLDYNKIKKEYIRLHTETPSGKVKATLLEIEPAAETALKSFGKYSVLIDTFGEPSSVFYEIGDYAKELRETGFKASVTSYLNCAVLTIELI